jgi:hypothetical protein
MDQPQRVTTLPADRYMTCGAPVGVATGPGPMTRRENPRLLKVITLPDILPRRARPYPALIPSRTSPHRLHASAARRKPLAMPIACIAPLMSFGLGQRSSSGMQAAQNSRPLRRARRSIIWFSGVMARSLPALPPATLAGQRGACQGHHHALHLHHGPADGLGGPTLAAPRPRPPPACVDGARPPSRPLHHVRRVACPREFVHLP